ncbi:MAG: CHAT domain-containing tetratricopeptide repeat protein, partial [Bacteroidales bacterium]|nr:CHAT domain-containing tetratricopeptide repeat protein [Bacteroidales bacterium]
SGIKLNSDGMYSEALDSFLLSLDIRKKIYGDDDFRLASMYNAISIVYKNSGLYDLAIENSLNAEKAYIKGYGENYRGIAGVYLNIGNIYKNKLNYNDALRYYNQAVIVYLNQDKVNSIEVAWAYYSIAEIYFRLYKYNEALNIIFSQLEEADEDTQILYYELLGAIYQELNDFSNASLYYNKAIELSIQLYSENDNGVAYEYLNYASFLSNMGNVEQAMQILNKAYNIFSQTEKKTGINISEYYRALGRLMENKPIASKDIQTFKRQKYKNLEESVNWYKKALTALNFPEEISPNMNWDTIFLISKISCVDMLKSVADKYMLMAQIIENDDKNIYRQSLINAIEYYKVTGHLLQRAKKEISGDDSKILLTELEQSTFIKTIQASYKAFELTQNNEYLELAFNNAELLKAGSIFDKLSDQMARENSLVPDSLIQKEHLLNTRITTYSEILFNETKSANPDSAKVAKADSIIFHLKKQRSELNDYLVENYKDYYQLKYSDASVTTADIQKKLKKNEAVIEFVLNENDSLPELYSFLLTNSEKQFIKQEITPSFLDQIQTVFHFMSNSRYMFTKNEDSKDFCIASHILYQKLITPFKTEIGSKKLIIIPDGKLSYIPFDALLEELPDTNATINFSQLSYLLKNNCINYSYSTNLLFGLQTSRHKPNKKVLAFAPEYTTETVNFENQQIYLTPLPGVQREVELIANEIKTKLFKGNDANEINFRNHVEKFGILHLAMHAFINDSLPAFSRFAFVQNGDNQTESDGWLNTADIYNLHLNAGLTVLSACNTGSGTLRKGEGVMSLARGFLYAGCPSIIMTLWEVEDNSGTKIMSTFYQHLRKGKSKDEALRLAKLDYLQNANSRLAHPHYWLGYVSIGDSSPLFLSYDFYFFSLLFLALAGITTEQIIRIRKARKKRAKN